MKKNLIRELLFNIFTILSFGERMSGLVSELFSLLVRQPRSQIKVDFLDKTEI